MPQAFMDSAYHLTIDGQEVTGQVSVQSTGGWESFQCIGTHAASSVIHDRVIRGTTPLAVALGPLEGVLGLVDGVLTPVPTSPGVGAAP